MYARRRNELSDSPFGQKETGLKAWGAIVQEVDIDSLITWGKSDPVRSTGLRSGSKVLTKSCGTFVVEISGGYYNKDPLEENGADENFPVVSVKYGDVVIAKRLYIGTFFQRSCFTSSCEPQLDPEKWADTIDISPENNGKAHIQYYFLSFLRDR